MALEEEPCLDVKEEAQDKKKDPLADTNMENYGGKEHRDLAHNIAMTQKEWKIVGEWKEKSKLGVIGWRIEKFRVKPWKELGTFFDGDSFIFLNAYKKDPNKEAISYNVHFWLGKNTSQDEAGAAAIKTVELDDYLRDLPVQFREVQGAESKEFLGLFQSLNIKIGGVDSGFRKVEKKTWKTRLYRVTTKKCPRSKKESKKAQSFEVPLQVESLMLGDMYLLDVGTELYVFETQGASAKERMAANKLMNDIADERHGKVKRKKHVDMQDSPEKDKEVADFWGYFPGGKPKELVSPKEVIAAMEKEQAELEEMYRNHVNQMIHITNEKGTMEENILCEGILDKGFLAKEQDDVIIVDVGRVVYVWIGRDANKEEIRHAVTLAADFLKKHNRPMSTPIKRISDGGEPADFWKCFGVEHVPNDIWMA